MENELSFNRWASLMLEVYKSNKNGYWAVLMPFIVAYRSAILKEHGYCPTLFLTGPTCSGKTELAKSIQSIFCNNTQIFCLNTNTDAAFFSLINSSNDLEIFDEYRDEHITDAKFQLLKATVFDGTARYTKEYKNQVDIIENNCTPLIIGDEIPCRDDYSLANRVVILPLSKTHWSLGESIIFKTLKNYENQGLLNILSEIIGIKSVFLDQYQNCFHMVKEELLSIFESRQICFAPRILHTVSFFTAMVKLIETQETTIKLPFTYADFFTISIDYIFEHSSYQPE